MDGNFLIFRCFETRPVKLGLASSEQWMDVVWSLLVTLLSLSILAMWSSKQGAVSSLNGSNGTGETLLLQLDDDGLLCFLIFHSFGILYLFLWPLSSMSPFTGSDFTFPSGEGEYGTRFVIVVVPLTSVVGDLPFLDGSFLSLSSASPPFLLLLLRLSVDGSTLLRHLIVVKGVASIGFFEWGLASTSDLKGT